jgi:hypothetical protein
VAFKNWNFKLFISFFALKTRQSPLSPFPPFPFGLLFPSGQQGREREKERGKSLV